MKEGWKMVKLGDVCEVVGGGTPSKNNGAFFAGTIPWATVRDLRSKDLESTEYSITEDAVKSSSTRIIPSDNLVIATRVGLGKFSVVRQPTAINQDLRGIIPKDTDLLRPEFLTYWYASRADDVKAAGTGATVQGVKGDFIKNLQLPLPPLEEQRRIVAFLDEAFAAIETARRNTERNLENAKELFEGYLERVFAEATSVEDRCFADGSWLEIIDGDRGNQYPKQSDFHTEGHCLFLNTKNVTKHGFIFDSTVFLTKEKDAAMRKGRMQTGDIVMTTRGTIGNVALLDASVPFKSIRINSGMLILRVNPSIVRPAFMELMLRSGMIRRQIAEAQSGAAQPQLPIRALSRFTVPIPRDLPKQDRILALAASWTRQTDRLATVYAKRRAALQELEYRTLSTALAK